MTNRYLFVHSLCTHCPRIKNVIPKINLKLKPENKIRIIDIASEDYNINLHSITKIIKFENVPFLYLDGFCMEGVTSSQYAKNYIEQYLKMQGEIE